MGGNDGLASRRALSATYAFTDTLFCCVCEVVDNVNRCFAQTRLMRQHTPRDPLDLRHARFKTSWACIPEMMD
jgi:hypothetical protein